MTPKQSIVTYTDIISSTPLPTCLTFTFFFYIFQGLPQFQNIIIRLMQSDQVPKLVIFIQPVDHKIHHIFIVCDQDKKMVNIYIININFIEIHT